MSQERAAPGQDRQVSAAADVGKQLGVAGAIREPGPSVPLVLLGLNSRGVGGGWRRRWSPPR